MNVALPDSLREFALLRSQECGCVSVDEYVGRLVEADQERRAREQLEEELSRGLASERISVSSGDFDRLRETIRSRYENGTAP